MIETINGTTVIIDYDMIEEMPEEPEDYIDYLRMLNNNNNLKENNNMIEECKVTELKDIEKVVITKNNNGTYTIETNATIKENLLGIEHKIGLEIPMAKLNGRIIEGKTPSGKRKFEFCFKGDCLENRNGETIKFNLTEDNQE